MKVALVLLLVAPVASLHGVASFHVRSGACSCIAWKSAYADYNVKCGQGYELGVVGEYALPRDRLPPTFSPARDVYPEFCGFYTKSSFTGCLNKGYGTPSEQWCYVSAACEGSSRVEGTDMAIKWCSEADNLLNHTDPLEVNRLALADDQHPGLLGKLSYATAPYKWSDIEAASGLSDNVLRDSHMWAMLAGSQWTGPHEVTPFATAKLQETKSSGIPTIFDEDNGHGGGTLIWGDKIHVSGALPGTKFPGYACVQGC